MNVATLQILLFLTVIAGISLAGSLIIKIWFKGKTKKISYLRIFAQISSQFALFYLISYPLLLFFVLLTLLIATIILGRFFCGWICPFGFYMDLASLLRQTFKIRYIDLSERANRILHKLRYATFCFILILPLFLINPSNSPTSASVLYLHGPFNPYRVLLGPLVPIVAPWKILFDINLNFPYVDQIVYYSSSDFILFNVFIFVAFSIISSFMIRRFWCRFCPTGISISVINKIKGFSWIPFLYLKKAKEKCTKCAICKRVCTVQVTNVYEQSGGKIDSSMCMLCFRCVEMCPYQECLSVEFYGKTLFKSRNWLEK